ncbi:MAG: hypothetical protein WEB06_03270 [Actinomycetota bacterium]
MSTSKAERLLARAAKSKVRLRRHLLVAAALREVLGSDPIVVGGTAEEFWTSDEYRETDLDVCAPLTTAERKTLGSLGFEREGRHWYHASSRVAVEFPDSTIDGDPERTVLESVPGGAARIIGVDDLYLDRLRQATMNEDIEDVHFQSTLAVAAACFDVIDWRYVRSRLAAIEETDRTVGSAMKRINTRVRRRALSVSRQ